ncbi:DUF1064 domain-containing protein [Iocasia frigidifontis]|uniref:DUF1064 domain-containing protein n=1 Tax=Iocasia fonsfrigidae TaxID=2682810 RepID=A0A8A7KF91_9FIRM|nr:DUF1064 domain-containing protein [Iocasia fonsfrigidae]QTL96542.1 DUF1064 domain-containing protein [Iocasia fonsfrigidae]
MTRISIAQAKKMGIDIPEELERQARKFKNMKPVVDGITFDSQKEANYYCELKIQKRVGEIKDFELQPEFILQEGFRDSSGKWHHPIKYRADFRVKYPDEKEEIVDTKGHKTKVYRIKKKMLLKKYPEINFKEE